MAITDPESVIANPGQRDLENIRDPSAHVTQIGSHNVEIHIEHETGWDRLSSHVQVGLPECLLHRLPLVVAKRCTAFLTARSHGHQFRALHIPHERVLPRCSPVQTDRGLGQHSVKKYQNQEDGVVDHNVGSDEFPKTPTTKGGRTAGRL